MLPCVLCSSLRSMAEKKKNYIQKEEPMCHTARKRPQKRGSLPELIACLPHNPQGRTFNCTEKASPHEGNTELHGLPLFTWTHPEVYNEAWVQSVRGPCHLKHSVHTLPAMESQGKDPAGGHGEHAGETGTCQPDATPRTHNLISPLG